VIVYPFLPEPCPFTLLTGLDGDHQPFVGRVAPQPAEGVPYSHVGDISVAVEVIRTVLIIQSVAIIIHPYPQSPVRAGSICIREEMRPAVDIHHRYYIEHVTVYNISYLSNFPVVCQQPVGQVKTNLPCLDLVAVDVAVDIHSRLGKWLRSEEH